LVEPLVCPESVQARKKYRADDIDHLRHLVVGTEDYLDYWLARERSG